MRQLSDLAWMMPLKASQKFVLLKLADAADVNHIAFPGVPEIAWSTGLSERQVQRDLKELHTQKLIDRQFRDNRSTMYTVLPNSKGRVAEDLRRLRDARRQEKLKEYALTGSRAME